MTTFLWRTSRCLPQRGRIGIFNRSYYEEVLVVRVHPELLARQKLPVAQVTRDFWQQRFDDLNAFEHYLAGNGVLVLKFFLRVSRQEQNDVSSAAGWIRFGEPLGIFVRRRFRSASIGTIT